MRVIDPVNRKRAPGTSAKLPAPGSVRCVDRGRLIGLRNRMRDSDETVAERARATFAELVEVSSAQVAARRAAQPKPAFDDSLPIHAERDRLIGLIRSHRIVIVAGETGSGKTTQLPKLALAAGQGAAGMIGCTQPRRIAARSVARRVAEELRSPLGETVGYQVRFDDRVGDRTAIKFMTDGILLAEAQADRWLSAYDTIIVDEAHERSLNIDFLLGLLKQLLRKRDDLKVIVTSATIDTGRFAAFFEDAPVVEIPGRTYPVERRYRPIADRGRDDRGLNHALIDVIAEIGREDGQGDILAFLPGEREIRDAHKALTEQHLRHTEILPLYARLSARDQDRVFRPDVGRRIVLATNVAETSLTVPRIRYVIDAGTARVSRYSARSKVQRLEIEPVAQANAEQRAGRCGRVGPGICYRLYDEADFNARPPFSDPEILRSSLANVILRMLALGLGDIEAFPFIDPPGDRAIREGLQQLTELKAITADRRLTTIGQQMARFPVDVQLSRMLVEAQQLGSLRELLVIVAFFGIQDPRERPHEVRALADSRHAEYADSRSDFLGAWKLWQAFDEAHAELGSSRLRTWCEDRFLNFMRMREWRELHRQLLTMVDQAGWKLNDKTADYEAIHRAILAGLPAGVARKIEKGEYEGTRVRGFAIFPGSALAKSQPNWLLSLSVIVTSRMYAHMNARIEPEWLYDQAGHLLKRTVFEPHWDRDRGRVIAYEQATLYALVVHARKRVDFARTDPAGARTIFLHEGLAECDLDSRSDFVAENAQALAMAREREAMRRRQGLVVDAGVRAQFFEALIPANVASTRELDQWYRALPKPERRKLVWRIEDLLVADDRDSEFPKFIDLVGHRFGLDYRFEPGHEADGVTITVPLAWLNALPVASLDWLVPGLLPAKVAELIRGLPKTLRRHFVPAPDFARAFAEAESPRDQSLTNALAGWMRRIGGVDVVESDFDPTQLPAHLHVRIELLDEKGGTLATDRDISALQARYGARARHAFAERAAGGLARTGLTRFEPDELPDYVESEAGMRAWPAFVDRGDDVDLVVFETPEEAAESHVHGILRLLHLRLADPRRRLARQLPIDAKSQFAWASIGSLETLRTDIVDCALDTLLRSAPDRSPRSRSAFEALAGDISDRLGRAANERALAVRAALAAMSETAPKLSPPLMGFAAANFDDLRSQLARLFPPDLGRSIPHERLAEYPRYLKAMSLRAERLQADPRRDQARMLIVQDFEQRLAHLPSDSATMSERAALRWLIEELRVSLFAQDLGTRESVSEKRIEKRLHALESRRMS
jgi:ATP-dependent helicase HrpA